MVWLFFSGGGCNSIPFMHFLLPLWWKYFPVNKCVHISISTFIFNPCIKHKTTLILWKTEKSLKELWRKLQAGAELTEEKTTILVLSQPPTCAVESPAPIPEKTVTVQKHLHCLRRLFHHTTSVHSDHFAHKWPLLLILWNYLIQKSSWSNGSNNDKESTKELLLVSEKREYNTNRLCNETDVLGCWNKAKG